MASSNRPIGVQHSPITVRDEGQLRVHHGHRVLDKRVGRHLHLVFADALLEFLVGVLRRVDTGLLRGALVQLLGPTHHAFDDSPPASDKVGYVWERPT